MRKHHIAREIETNPSDELQNTLTTIFAMTLLPNKSTVYYPGSEPLALSELGSKIIEINSALYNKIKSSIDPKKAKIIFEERWLISMKIGYAKLGPNDTRLLTYVYHGKPKRHFVIYDKDLVKHIDRCIDLGAQLNRSIFYLNKTYLQREHKQALKPPSYWNHWESGIERLFYAEITDPLIVNYYRDTIQNGSHPKDKTVTVYDIGGGKARLGEKIIKASIEAKINLDYTLVESNHSSVVEAKNIFAQFTNKNVKITVLPSKFEDSELDPVANFIISSGGPMNFNIVSLSDAEKNARKMASLVDEGGTFLATGQTSVMVKPKFFKSQGLEAIKYSATFVPPSHMGHTEANELKRVTHYFTGTSHVPFYVYKRPAAKPVSQQDQTKFREYNKNAFFCVVKKNGISVRTRGEPQHEIGFIKYFQNNK